MKLEEKDILMRIFISENEKYENKLLYEQIVLHAKKMKIAGATVLRGILGYGASFHLHSSKIVNISNNLPVVVEIIDTEENIHKLMPFIDEAVVDGFVTMEKVDVIQYRHNDKRAKGQKGNA